jgi:hypothetical protein
MNNKIVLGSLLLLVIFIITPLASAYNPLPEQLLTPQPITETQEGILGTAYIVIVVLTYTPGQGIKPCQGADIHLRSFLHSYNGTTNEKGIHIFPVHTALLREKYYITTASIQLQNTTMQRIGLIHIRAKQIIYKGFLFVVTAES